MFWTRWQAKARDTEARKRAALKLGQTGGRRAFEALVGLLEDPEWSVRVAALEALGALAPGPTVEPMITAIRNAESLDDRAAAEVRAAAVAALERTGARAVSPLQQAARDKSPRVREAAVVALGGIADAQAMPILVAALGDDRSNVRQAAARALARAKIADSVGALLAALDHRDPTTRRSVVEALGETGDPRAVEGLSRVVADHERPVRDAAVKALGRIGSRSAVEALVGAFQSADRDLRQAAGDALRAVTWEPRGERERAVAAVVRGDYAASAAEGPVAIDLLLMVLEAKDPPTRKAAAEALGSLRHPRAAKALAGLLADRDDSVRSSAARALVEVGPAGAISVIDLLDDRAGPARDAAVGILRDTGAARVASLFLSELTERGFVRDESARLIITPSSEAFDRARSLAASLDALLRHVARMLDEKALDSLAALFDVGLVCRPPSRGAELADVLDDRINCADIRKRARTELKRRGIGAPEEPD